MSKPNPERLRRTEKIQALLKSGKSRQEVTEILGVSLATVDRARIGMDRLPKGGRRPGSGRPATAARKPDGSHEIDRQDGLGPVPTQPYCADCDSPCEFGECDPPHLCRKHAACARCNPCNSDHPNQTGGK